MATRLMRLEHEIDLRPHRKLAVLVPLYNIYYIITCIVCTIL